MKKIIGLIVLLCLFTGFSACAAPELPDPTDTVKDFYESSIKSPESDMAKQMLETSDFRAIAKDNPELEEMFGIFVKAYLSDIKYEIQPEETVVNNKEKTAEVLIKVSCVAFFKLDMQVKALVVQYREEQMLTGIMPMQEELDAYYFEAAIELINNGKAERTEGFQKAQLCYNGDSEGWELTNGDKLISDFM